MTKPILCVDFDGVLHSYESGWQGADVIPDPPVPGAIEFLQAALEFFEVHIFSSRSHQPGGIPAMERWVRHHAVGDHVSLRRKFWTDRIKFPTAKPAAFVTLDDRAVPFRGTFPDPVTRLFLPWYYAKASPLRRRRPI